MIFFVSSNGLFLDSEGNRFDRISCIGEFTRYGGEGVPNEGDHITKIAPVFS